MRKMCNLEASLTNQVLRSKTGLNVKRPLRQENYKALLQSLLYHDVLKDFRFCQQMISTLHLREHNEFK